MFSLFLKSIFWIESSDSIQKLHKLIYSNQFVQQTISIELFAGQLRTMIPLGRN